MNETFPRSAGLPLDLRPSDLVTAAATGLLTLPDPARRGPVGRFALRSAVATAAGAAMWWGTREDPELRFDPERRAAMTVGAVGLVYGVAELGEALDAAIQRRLVRWGVRRPRAAAALVGAGLSLGMSVLERRTTPTLPDDDEAVGPTYRSLPPSVRELADAILAQTEDYDSVRLRAQLAVARQEVWGEESGPVRFVELAVPDDVEPAVPHDFTFPVSARFTSERGVPCTVMLLVAGGRLATILVDVEGQAWGPLADDWDPRGGDEDPLADVGLPDVGSVTFLTETSARG